MEGIKQEWSQGNFCGAGTYFLIWIGVKYVFNLWLSSKCTFKNILFHLTQLVEENEDTDTQCS